MGIFIYNLNNDKTAEIQKSTELQSQVNSLNGTVSDLQRKITSISETISSNSSNNGGSKDTNAITTILIENEALDILKSRFYIIEKIYFSPDIFLMLHLVKK